MTTLETQRLILKGWRKSDVDDLHDIMKNSSVIMGGQEPHANIYVTLDVLNEYTIFITRNNIAVIIVCPSGCFAKGYIIFSGQSAKCGEKQFLCFQ